MGKNKSQIKKPYNVSELNVLDPIQVVAKKLYSDRINNNYIRSKISKKRT